MNLLLALPAVKMEVVLLLTALPTRGQKALLAVIKSGNFGRVIQLMSERRLTNNDLLKGAET